MTLGERDLQARDEQLSPRTTHTSIACSWQSASLFDKTLGFHTYWYIASSGSHKGRSSESCLRPICQDSKTRRPNSGTRASLHTKTRYTAKHWRKHRATSIRLAVEGFHPTLAGQYPVYRVLDMQVDTNTVVALRTHLCPDDIGFPLPTRQLRQAKGHRFCLVGKRLPETTYEKKI